jgi:hypothetical protein
MPRGFVWGLYIDDRDVSWALRVDADHALSPQRGWLDGDASGLPPLPRGWLPRAVVGIEPDGALHQAVVARRDADLWTGVVTEFDIERSDSGIETCQVIRQLAERSRLAGV